jgi:hypothetical protein
MLRFGRDMSYQHFLSAAASIAVAAAAAGVAAAAAIQELFHHQLSSNLQRKCPGKPTTFAIEVYAPQSSRDCCFSVI